MTIEDTSANEATPTKGAPGKKIGKDNFSCVLDWLAAHPGGTNVECSEALGLSVMAVGRHVKKIRELWPFHTNDGDILVEAQRKLAQEGWNCGNGNLRAAWLVALVNRHPGIATNSSALERLDCIAYEAGPTVMRKFVGHLVDDITDDDIPF